VLTRKRTNLGNDSRSVCLWHRDRIDSVDGSEGGIRKGRGRGVPTAPKFWNLEVELCAKLKYPGIVGRRHLSEVSIRTA